MAPRRYAMIGTGAIGGYYGACLQRGGAEVHFLVNSDYDVVAQRGLVIESTAGDFALAVQAHRTTATMPPIDVVVIGFKTTQNRLLPELLGPILGPESAILTLQNGFAIEDELARWVGRRPILGGLCFICANKIGPGTIRHLEYGQVLLGQYSPTGQPAGRSPLMEAIAADFQAGKVAMDVTDDLRLARWRKLVWNIPFNGLSVVINATTDAMVADPNSRQLVEQLMAEVIETARQDGDRLSPGQGRHLPGDLIAQMMAHTEQMTPYRTSMKIDFDQGRPLEVEAIFGQPLRTAQALGVAVPSIEMLYHQLKAIDRALQRRGPGQSG